MRIGFALAKLCYGEAAITLHDFDIAGQLLTLSLNQISNCWPMQRFIELPFSCCLSEKPMYA